MVDSYQLKFKLLLLNVDNGFDIHVLCGGGGGGGGGGGFVDYVVNSRWPKLQLVGSQCIGESLEIHVICDRFSLV
jgi:hypothetical protein